MMFLCSNSHRGQGDDAQRLARRLEALVTAQVPATRKAR
jgi:hypothetical protein